MAVQPNTAQFFARLDAATNALAARINKLIANADLTDDEKAEGERIASGLEALGRDPENPLPEPAPPV